MTLPKWVLRYLSRCQRQRQLGHGKLWTTDKRRPTRRAYCDAIHIAGQGAGGFWLYACQNTPGRERDATWVGVAPTIESARCWAARVPFSGARDRQQHEAACMAYSAAKRKGLIK